MSGLYVTGYCIYLTACHLFLKWVDKHYPEDIPEVEF